MALRMLQPSRLLNDPRRMFGLGMNDFAGAIGIFCVWSWAFENTSASAFGLPVAVVSLIAIAPIRMRYRTKIIRDWISFHIRGRSLYDPK